MERKAKKERGRYSCCLSKHYQQKMHVFTKMKAPLWSKRVNFAKKVSESSAYISIRNEWFSSRITLFIATYCPDKTAGVFVLEASVKKYLQLYLQQQ